MFNNLEKMMNAWNAIFDAMNELDADALTPILCMAADFVAVKNNRNTADLLEELLPVIRQVNESEGAMMI